MTQKTRPADQRFSLETLETVAKWKESGEMRDLLLGGLTIVKIDYEHARVSLRVR